MQSLTHQFLAFCRSKPADERYSYMDNCGCAFHQFLVAQGAGVDWVGGYDWTDRAGVTHEIPGALVYNLGSARGESTFGALTTRLEAALATVA